MSREMTFTEVQRRRALEDEAAAFPMDEESFRAFYDRTSRGLWAYLARVTGDRQAADDLLQETFYRFLRASAPFENEAHRRNSLYRIATNLARDARRRSVFRGPFGGDVESLPSADSPGAADRSADLTRAMARLKPRERAMLWLAYAEGASHGEIAEALGLGAPSVKVMLFRARRRLASLLGRESKGEAS